MKAAARVVVERLSANGLAVGLPRTVFATLVDNALTHAGAGDTPVAAVYLDGEDVVVTSKDSGQTIASSADAKIELVRRIQFPAEDADPPPGAPAGIPWLARLLTERGGRGRLEFMAGSGRLTFSDGVWSCRRENLVISGFTASAVLPVT
jgi:hypothetical protein